MSIAAMNQSVANPGLEDRPARVVFYLYFPGGGIGHYTHELLTRMNRSPDVRAELVCPADYRWLEQATYPVWPGLEGVGGPRCLRRKTRFLRAQFSGPRRLCQRLREIGAQIVHFSQFNYLTFPLWRSALRQTGVRVATTVHDVRRHTAILNRRYETRQLKSFYRTADALFLHSQAQAADLQDFAQVEKRRIHVVPHGPYDYGEPRESVARLRQRYGLPADSQVALFFGSVRDPKNLDLLLRVLPDHRNSLHLVVAGQGGARGHRGIESYKRLARALDVEDNVLFLERYVPEDEVPDLFSLCDWVAVPYSRTFTSQSGVLNLATRYRRPALLSGAATFAETMAQCEIGVLVEPDDLAALEAGVREIKRQVERNHHYEFEHYDRLFSWEENVNRSIAVYRSLLARPTGSSLSSGPLP